ncbi:MAG: hypothetical protein M1393_04790 [Candidatus Thermoplasmatota archaeon]|nr:hypothetical protein [Candidatus Thermoplasmatota archaeon]
MASTRTISGHRTLKSPDLPFDYVVIRRFEKDTEFWNENNVERLLVLRRNHISTRIGSIVLAGYGNVDLGAPGTSLLAIYSADEIVPTWSLWSLEVKTEDNAKILTLWFNSCFHLIYLLNHRTEKRGTVMQWRKNVLMNAPVLNFERLDSEIRGEMLKFFNDHASDLWDPLIAQYMGPTDLRVNLDALVAKALGFTENEILDRINDIHATISTYLQGLATRMTRDR